MWDDPAIAVFLRFSVLSTPISNIHFVILFAPLHHASDQSRQFCVLTVWRS
jgi:hypothetical protein